MLCTSGFVDDVMFSDNDVQRWQYLRERCAGASSHKFQTYSPEDDTLFDLVSDDGMRGAGSGWWPAACGIEAGDEVCCVRLSCLSC